MSGFSIDIKERRAARDADDWTGEIHIGTFCERFPVASGFWTAAQYRAQWISGLRRLLDGAPSSCLVASITDPVSSNFLTLWIVYRDGSEAIFQQRLVILSELPKPFRDGDPYEVIGERRTTTEDGDPISEWSVDLQAIATFVAEHE